MSAYDWDRAIAAWEAWECSPLAERIDLATRDLALEWGDDHAAARAIAIIALTDGAAC